MAGIIKASEQNGPRVELLKLADLAEEARAVVLEAREEAARILADARAAAAGEAERIRREARDEGLAQGLDEGRRQASAETRDDLAAVSSELTGLAGKVVGELAKAQAELPYRVRRELLEMAIVLAEKIVGTVAAADAGAAVENLGKALELVGRQIEITILVNNDQLEMLREHMRNLVDVLEIKGRVSLVADEAVSPGGVKVITRYGQIDATVQTQLANVAAALTGRRSSACGEYKPAARQSKRKKPAQALQTVPRESRDDESV